MFRIGGDRLRGFGRIAVGIDAQREAAGVARATRSENETVSGEVNEVDDIRPAYAPTEEIRPPEPAIAPFGVV